MYVSQDRCNACTVRCKYNSDDARTVSCEVYILFFQGKFYSYFSVSITHKKTGSNGMFRTNTNALVCVGRVFINKFLYFTSKVTSTVTCICVCRTIENKRGRACMTVNRSVNQHLQNREQCLKSDESGAEQDKYPVTVQSLLLQQVVYTYCTQYRLHNAQITVNVLTTTH